MAVTTGPSFIELYTPKLVTVLREGYHLADLRADLVSGLTVAIVALPLSMAIAIASGVTPDRGLYTSIVGGFVVSALGGSRFQIGGPAGAFIVLVSATAARYGLDGLLLAVLLSGLIMLASGLLRLGTFIKYIPYPVTVAFTFGIAIIIFASQITDLLGLTLPGPEPGPFVAKLEALWARLADGQRRRCRHFRRFPLARSCWSAAIRPHWPSYLIAVCLGVDPRLCFCICMWRPSARASAEFRARCRCRTCPSSRWLRSSRSFPRHSPSRSWAVSRACSRPSSPTA